MKKITLCGSTKFKKSFEEFNALLTLQGNLVYSVGVFGHSGRVVWSEQKVLLDKVHLEKIKQSDEIFVLDVGGYIGESTQKEILYAQRLGRNIRYLSKEYPEWTES